MPETSLTVREGPVDSIALPTDAEPRQHRFYESVGPTDIRALAPPIRTFVRFEPG